MTHGRATGLVISIGMALALPSAAAASGDRLRSSDELTGNAVPGELIVHYRAGASAGSRTGALRGAGARVKRHLLLADTELVSVPQGGERAAMSRLNLDHSVVYAEPNAIVHADVTPGDTQFGQLWGLNNTGQSVNGVAGVRDADIDAPEAWNMGFGLGSTVRVAVIDTGVARSHADLAPNMFTNPGESGALATNGIDDDANGFVDDWRGWDFVNGDNNPEDDNHHGTHVAGTIAARTHNGLGVSGVAAFPHTTTSAIWYGPKIVAIKVLNAAGSGSIAGIADGIVYAGKIGAKVGNLSLGGSGTSLTYDNALRASPNTLFAIAAGNDGVDNDTSPHAPCVPNGTDPPNKICVAATDNKDALASFSNFGATQVDLAAPGVDILSTVPTPAAAFSDTFETGITGRWTTNDAGQTGAPRWARTTLFHTSGGNSLTDSPGGTAAAPTLYENNQNNWARNTNPINLTGLIGCRVFARAKISTEEGFDVFRIEASTSPTTGYQQLFSFSGHGEGFIESVLPATFNGQSSVYVRLRMSSDGSEQDDGVYIDDFAVNCFRPSASPPTYEYLNGTSMATPHVAGAMTFLATRYPTLTPAQIKDRIMRSVDKKAALAGKTVTGGRLNLYKATAESTAAVSGGVLRWTAGAGEKNLVTVTRFTDTDGIAKYKITDPYSTSTLTPQGGSRIVPGTGCSRISDNTVKCPVAGITRIILTGGDQDDTINASTIAIALSIDGGPGNDTLTAGTAADTLVGGTGADKFTAGTGNDRISARNNDVDSTFSCGENTGDTDTVTADSTPDDPVTASATNCEVVNKG